MRNGVSGILGDPLKTVMFMTVLFFQLPSAAEPLMPPDSGCIKWRDSLVVAGMHSLDSGRIADARRYFTGAFRCGMRKDSMHFYIAELYLRQMALDTALVFNQAVEQAGTFPHELWTLQRAKIYWLLGRKKIADSLMASLQKNERHDFQFSISATRNMMTLNRFTFIPQHLQFSPGGDIDDRGGQSLYYRYFCKNGRHKLPWYLQFSTNSFFPVPTPNFNDELSDTLFQTYGLAAGIGSFALTPELSGGLRIRMHHDGKNDLFPNGRLSFPAGKKSLLIVSHDQKWVEYGVLDEYKTDVSFLRVLSARSFTGSLNVTITHHYSRSDIYQSRLDSSGIYRPLPKAYIAMDSVALATSAETIHYFTDEACTHPFSTILRNSWNRQPSMYFMTAPEHNMNMSINYSCACPLPYTVTITLNGNVQGIYYPKKITWYTTGNTALAGETAQSIFRKCAMVLNIIDNTYYLVTDRLETSYHPTTLFKLHYHEKTRIDGFFLVSSTIEKHFGVFGDLSGTMSFIKGISTFNETDPMVTFNHLWEFSVGWKKDITIQK